MGNSKMMLSKEESLLVDKKKNIKTQIHRKQANYLTKYVNRMKRAAQKIFNKELINKKGKLNKS